MHQSDNCAQINIHDVVVEREGRQRQLNLTTEDLKPSIALRGVLVPIIIRAGKTLVAGERRLTSCRELLAEGLTYPGAPNIPYRLFENLDPIEAQIIELEENLRRRDLHWRDQVKSIGRIHELYSGRSPDWTGTDTAKSLGMSPNNVSTYLRVFRSLDDPRIANVSGMTTAYNLLTRVDQRAVSDAMSDIMEIGKSIIEGVDRDAPPGGEDEGGTIGATATATATAPNPIDRTTAPQPTAPAPAKPKIRPAEESILHTSFLDWAPAYTGKPFNFIHCDFPYGINVFAGAMSGKNEWGAGDGAYDDSPDVYWDLCKCLCENLDSLMSHSAHLMFWFSMEHYTETLRFFSQNAPSLHFQTFPLMWLKSDNVGIMPDPKRGPRRIYETALLASREDRLIVKPVANAYSSPTDKTHHHSTKPEPMLRHFFQMLVDENTRMLDPTCGSASALRAAESLNAASVLGLEADDEHCANARSALRKFRLLRSAS